jgi:hypothetical protein
MLKRGTWFNYQVLIEGGLDALEEQTMFPNSVHLLAPEAQQRVLEPTPPLRAGHRGQQTPPPHQQHPQPPAYRSGRDVRGVSWEDPSQSAAAASGSAKGAVRGGIGLVPSDIVRRAWDLRSLDDLVAWVADPTWDMIRGHVTNLALKPGADWVGADWIDWAAAE